MNDSTLAQPKQSSAWVKVKNPAAKNKFCQPVTVRILRTNEVAVGCHRFKGGFMSTRWLARPESGPRRKRIPPRCRRRFSEEPPKVGSRREAEGRDANRAAWGGRPEWRRLLRARS